MKSFLKYILPPFFYDLLKRLLNLFKELMYFFDLLQRPDILFDGDNSLFKLTLSSSKIYAEYGCGESTVWVANNTSSKILSVDSSQEWIEKVKERVSKSDILKIHWVDLGKLGSWGTPLSYDNSLNFKDYTDWIWKQDLSPDVVLVDGRFRVACFLTSLLNSKEGTRIIFDDYTNRPHYHFVENFVMPFQTCGRQALFMVPSKNLIDSKQVMEALEKFRFDLS